MDQTAMGLLTLATILMGVMVVLSIIATTYLYHYFSGLIEQQQSAISLIHEEITSISSDVTKLSKIMDKPDENGEQPEKVQSHQVKERDAKDKNIEKAKLLLNKGAELEEVIEECQLAQGEADLVRLSHRMDRLASYGS